jgi:hypothetical protein
MKKMPKIFTYFGFIFYFFSNEHEPIHVHVKHGDNETVFELILDNGELKEIRKRKKTGIEPLTEKDTKLQKHSFKNTTQTSLTNGLTFSC